jgi:hypothetical protein
MTRRALRITITVTLGLALAAPATASDGQIGKATKLLSGKRYATYIGGDSTSSGIDRSAVLCRSGRFTYTSTYVSAEAGAYAEETVEGRWRVVSARVRGSRGRAVVRYTTDAGETGRVEFVATSRGVRVDGSVAEVTRANC